jgi:hypothetical protein
MRRLWLLVLLALVGGAPAFAQSTTVSGTITDAGSQVWFGGTIQFRFRPADSNPTAQYIWNGAPFSSSSTFPSSPLQLNGSGAFSGLSIPSNTSIAPANSTWTVTVCPAATVANCYTKNLTITGGTQDISSQVIPPAVVVNLSVPLIGALAYTDNEVQGAPPGTDYFNVTDNRLHVCLFAGFPPCSWFVLNGGAGTVSSFSAGNLSPLFTTAVATSTTTPVLSFIPDTVANNLVLAGPTGGIVGTSGNASGNSVSPSVTVTSPASSGAALFVGTVAFPTQPGSFPTPSTPASGWTVIAQNGTYGVFSYPITATGAFTATSTLTNSAQWVASLYLTGSSGAVSLVQSVQMASGSVGNTTSTGTFASSVTVGHTILVVIGSGQAGGTPTCSSQDSLGNVFQPQTPIIGSVAQFVYFAPITVGGSDTVQVTCSTVSGGLFAGNIAAYELSAITSGTGTYSFRALTAADLPSGTVTGVTASSPVTSSGGATPNIACPTCVTSVSGTANQITSSGGTTPTLSIPSTFIAPGTFAATTSITDSGLTANRCVQTTTGGLLTVASGLCGTGTGSTQTEALLITSGICTNSGSAESKCSMGPFTWPTAFADSNYAITCSTTNPTSTSATNPGIYPIYWASKSATQFSLVMQSGSASAGGNTTVSEIDCIGVHP